MSRRSNSGQGGGSGQGPYVDGIAAVLTVALERHLGRQRGAAAIMIASRPLSGPDDGGPPEVLFGERASYPPTVQLLELNDQERKTVDLILAESLADPAFETWSDLVVMIRIAAGGVAINGMPSPVSRLSDPKAAEYRAGYLNVPPLERIKMLLALADEAR